MQLRVIFVLLLVGLVMLAGPGTVVSKENDNAFSLNREAEYDITIELTQGVISQIKKVHVNGVIEINNRAFLIIATQGFIKKDGSFISLDSVKTIILSNSNIIESIVSNIK